MDRSFFSYISGAFLGLSAVGIATLGFVWSPPGSSASAPKPDGGWRLLDGITYENITIFPVVSSSGYDTSAFLTLEDGLSSGEITVREQGAETLIRNRQGERPVPQAYNSGPAVNQLVLINHSKRPLLLLAGELVSGGKQDRIIAKDRIVAPGADPLPLDVFCVEHGRWSSGSQFSAGNLMVHPSVRERAAFDRQQSEVWSAVRSGTTSAAGSTGMSRGAGGGVVVEAAPLSQDRIAAEIAATAP